MGKAIYLLKKDKLWVRDCAGIPSFKYYVEHELRISVSQAHRLEQVFREVGSILEDGRLSIDISALTLLLPHLHGKTDEEKIKLIEDNKDLPIEAVKNNILEMTGNKEKCTDVCEHNGGFEMFKKCKDCGKFFVV
jgi:hypothetical protein